MPYAIWDGGLGDMVISIPDSKTARAFNDLVMPIIRIIQSSFAENRYLRDLRDSFHMLLCLSSLSSSKLIQY